jgi:hypothetical protein
MHTSCNGLLPTHLTTRQFLANLSFGPQHTPLLSRGHVVVCPRAAQSPEDVNNRDLHPAAEFERRPAPITGAHPAYGGRCTKCGGSHSLACSPEAVAALQDVLSLICQHQRLDYESVGAPDPRFSLDYLFTLGPGRMLGVLLATDSQGQQHVLKAFSGQITESWHIPGETRKRLASEAVAVMTCSTIRLHLCTVLTHIMRHCTAHTS